MAVSYKAIGRNIRSARQRAGLTQERVAEQLGISQLHYGRLERGNRRLSLDQLADVASVLHTPIIELLDGMTTDCALTRFSVHSNGIGTIIDFLCAGCSDQAKSLMLDICTLIARNDKY